MVSPGSNLYCPPLTLELSGIQLKSANQHGKWGFVGKVSFRPLHRRNSLCMSAKTAAWVRSPEILGAVAFSAAHPGRKPRQKQNHLQAGGLLDLMKDGLINPCYPAHCLPGTCFASIGSSKVHTNNLIYSIGSNFSLESQNSVAAPLHV